MKNDWEDIAELVVIGVSLLLGLAFALAIVVGTWRLALS